MWAIFHKCGKQAGAELGQAQIRLSQLRISWQHAVKRAIQIEKFEWDYFEV